MSTYFGVRKANLTSCSCHEVGIQEVAGIEDDALETVLWNPGVLFACLEILFCLRVLLQQSGEQE